MAKPRVVGKTATTTSKKGKRLSVSGTIFTGGMISLEEYNRKLIGRAGLDIYDEMRRSDGTTSAALRIVKLPIMSASWQVKPASDDQVDVDIAAKIQHNLDYIGWKQILREILTFLDFGFSVFEKVYDVIPSPELGDYIGVSQLGSMKQRTVFKWKMPDDSPGVIQLNITGQGAGEIAVPMEKLIVFSNDREGDNYEGRSLIRPAYKHWYIKEQLYKIDALAHEKQGLGLPNLKTPPDASTSDKEEAREVVKNIRANEAAYSEMPEGFEIEFLDMKANTTKDPISSINHHTTQIMKSVLAQFLELGSNTSKSGSNALSTDQSELFMKSEEFTADYITEQVNRHFIPEIVDINYPNVKKYPTLEYSDLSDSNTRTLADSVQKLVSSGALTPEATLEEHLRDIFDLPDLPEDIADDYNNRVLPKLGAPPGGNGPDAGQTASLKRVLNGLDKYIEASLNESKRRRKTKR